MRHVVCDRGAGDDSHGSNGFAAIGPTLSTAHMAAAVPTVAVVPAAADEVSAGIAHLFSAHAQDYQALAGRAAALTSSLCSA